MTDDALREIAVTTLQAHGKLTVAMFRQAVAERGAGADTTRLTAIARRVKEEHAAVQIAADEADSGAGTSEAVQGEVPAVVRDTMRYLEQVIAGAIQQTRTELHRSADLRVSDLQRQHDATCERLRAETQTQQRDYTDLQEAVAQIERELEQAVGRAEMLQERVQWADAQVAGLRAEVARARDEAAAARAALAEQRTEGSLLDRLKQLLSSRYRADGAGGAAPPSEGEESANEEEPE
jgi:chromosome segregation ATPase